MKVRAAWLELMRVVHGKQLLEYRNNRSKILRKPFKRRDYERGWHDLHV